jgi:rSAM/selenodomain-associated transferase 1
VRFPTARIQLFAKAPLVGAAKTRLIPALGAAGAARLHERLLRETLARLAPALLAPIELWCAPDCDHPVFVELAARYALTLRRQRGEDLGERLQQAAADALSGGAEAAEMVLLIGCDCPDLDAGYAAEALEALEGHDAVLGPAADGGYVLLGLRRAEPALFRGMPWGGEHVAALTRARMHSVGLRWRELAVLRDLDRPEDLVLLGRR